MEDSKKEKLLEAGVNVDVVLNRFCGNEKMMMHFILDFPQDPSFESYKSAMEEKRYEEAFEALHTLKGVCGNLAMDQLFDVAGRAVEFLRNNQNDQAEELFPEVVKEYEKIVEILDTIE